MGNIEQGEGPAKHEIDVCPVDLVQDEPRRPALFLERAVALGHRFDKKAWLEFPLKVNHANRVIRCPFRIARFKMGTYASSSWNSLDRRARFPRARRTEEDDIPSGHEMVDNKVQRGGWRRRRSRGTLRFRHVSEEFSNHSLVWLPHS